MFIADLFESAAKQLVVIYPGRFQPFHKGHKAVYDYLSSKYGRDNVWIATSNKTDNLKSPFSFSDKLQFMAATGVSADRVVETVQPYKAVELLNKFSPENTIVVYAVSKKDMEEDPRFKSWTKKDGSPAHFQPLPKDFKDCLPVAQHSYIEVVPTFDFTVMGHPMRSASEIRALYRTADEESKKAIITDLFTRYTPELQHILDTKLAASVNEHIVKVGNKYRLVSKHGNKNLGTYDTRAGAEKRERQVQYFKHIGEENLSEFAPGSGDDRENDPEDVLFRFAKMWYSAPDVATQRKVEQALAKVGWEIGEIESEEGGAFVMQIGDNDGNSYIAWSEEQLADLEETKVSKYADLGATKDTTHFIKNVTTGEIVSPHTSKADAEDALVAHYRTSGGDEYKIVRARKGVAEGEKNPFEKGSMGDALWRELSKTKKASPAQQQRNRERWAKRDAEKAAQQNAFNHKPDNWSQDFEHRMKQDVAENNNQVEAYGYAYNKQDQRVMWRKEFASEEQARKWADSKNATILGIKPLQKVEEGDVIQHKFGIKQDQKGKTPYYKNPDIDIPMYDTKRGTAYHDFHPNKGEPEPFEHFEVEPVSKSASNIIGITQDGKRVKISTATGMLADVLVAAYNRGGWTDQPLQKVDLTPSTPKVADTLGAKKKPHLRVVDEDAAGVGVVATNKKMAKDPRYSTSMTVDVGPDTPNKNLNAFNLIPKGKK